MTTGRRVTAVFSGNLHSLSVFSTQGGCTPSVGMHSVAYGQSLVCAVTNSPFLTGGTTQMVCEGWSGMGSVPLSGLTTNTGSFQMTGDSGIFWLWRREYRLSAEPQGAGAVSTRGAWVEEGDAVTVQATPEPYHGLFGWSGDIDGCPVNGTQLTAVMSKPRAIQAVFVESRTPKGTPLACLASHGLTKDEDLEVFLLETDEALGLDVFEVDQDVVGAHGRCSFAACQFCFLGVLCRID